MSPAPRDIYENDVDFTELASQDPAFAKKYSIPCLADTAPFYIPNEVTNIDVRLKPNKQLDFSDPESVLYDLSIPNPLFMHCLPCVSD